MNPEVLKPVDLSPDKKKIEYVEQVERGIEELLKDFPGNPEEYGHRAFLEFPNPAQILATQLFKMKRLAWAFQRFPIFDMGVLSLLRKQKFKMRVRSLPEEQEFDLFVPALYWADVSHEHYSDSASWHFVHDGSSGYMTSWNCGSYGTIPYNSEAVAHNRNILIGNIWEVAKCSVPKVPLATRAKIAKLRGHFDVVMMIFEASWTAELKQDPFIVGMLKKNAFLIDHFDLTQYEKYILSEHVTKPV